jgi:hypothetical protein
VILDELESDCAAEQKDKALAAAKAWAIAALPEKDRGKAVGWITRSIMRPRVNTLSPQDVPTAPATVGPREGGEPNAPKPAAAVTNPPRVWEEKQGVVRISTGEPDKNSSEGYCMWSRALSSDAGAGLLWRISKGDLSMLNGATAG